MTNRFDTKKFNRVIALIERSAGNAEIGDMWTETRSFPLDTPVAAIIDWAATRCSGRLMLSMDEGSPTVEAATQ